MTDILERLRMSVGFRSDAAAQTMVLAAEEIERLRIVLASIEAMDTPGANATARRMAAMARVGLATAWKPQNQTAGNPQETAKEVSDEQDG